MKFEKVKEGMIFGEEGIEDNAVLILKKTKRRLTMITLDGEELGGTSPQHWDNSPWQELDQLVGLESYVIKGCFENKTFQESLTSWWEA